MLPKGGTGSGLNLTPHPWTPVKWFEGGAQVERMQIDLDLRPPPVRGWGGARVGPAGFDPDPSHAGRWHRVG